MFITSLPSLFLLSKNMLQLDTQGQSTIKILYACTQWSFSELKPSVQLYYVVKSYHLQINCSKSILVAAVMQEPDREMFLSPVTCRVSTKHDSESYMFFFVLRTCTAQQSCMHGASDNDFVSESITEWKILNLLR